LYLGALAGYEKIYGSEHIEVMKTKYNLGNLYSKDPCKMKEAAEMYREALADYTNMYGGEHPDVMNKKETLDMLHSEDPCKMKEVLDMYVAALPVFQKMWGSEHRIVLHLRSGMGCAYQKLSSLEEAIKQFGLASVGFTILLGPDDEKTLNAQDQLKDCLKRWAVKRHLSDSILEDLNSKLECVWGSV